MTAGPGSDVEVNLDVDPPAGSPVASRRWLPLAWGAAGVAVGVLIGRAWLSAGPAEHQAPSPPQQSVPLVRMALGAYATTAPRAGRVGHRLVVEVPGVVVNESAGPLVVREVRVTGPGAALASDDFGFAGDLPLHIAPGDTQDLSFSLLSDCDVPVRPLPRINLVVTPEDGGAATAVDVRIPDLGRLWGSTLEPASCGVVP